LKGSSKERGGCHFLFSTGKQERVHQKGGGTSTLTKRPAENVGKTHKCKKRGVGLGGEEEIAGKIDQMLLGETVASPHKT